MNVNGEIRSRTVRVFLDGKDMGLLDLQDALKLAEHHELDLVEVSTSEQYPVCKIMDYSKFLFEKKKKERELQKKNHAVKLKEIKFSPNIGEHDYQVKLKKIREFITAGHKVQIYVDFRKIELKHKELGLELIKKCIVEMSGIAETDNGISSSGNSYTVILKPRK